MGIYAPWRLARIDIPNAAEHPDELVESLAMASVLPPAPSYRPLLPERAVKALSQAQLETIIHAGDAFTRDLPGHFKPNDAGDQLVPSADGNAYRTDTQFIMGMVTQQVCAPSTPGQKKCPDVPDGRELQVAEAVHANFIIETMDRLPARPCR